MNNPEFEDAVSRVLTYFEFFHYPPTSEELYLFLPYRISRPAFSRNLDILIKKGMVQLTEGHVVKAGRQCGSFFARKSHTQRLIAQALPYVRFGARIPWIVYMGFSGSLSMLNSSPQSDIDIFIVCKKNTLWTTRMLLLMYKKISSLFPRAHSNLWCFNLFFSEGHLELPQEKQTLYVGHEILQLKSIVDRGGVYDTMVSLNPWIARYFPNVNILSNQDVRKNDRNIMPGVRFIDAVARWIQVGWLAARGYRFVEKQGNLWFLQHDFEKKIPQNLNA